MDRSRNLLAESPTKRIEQCTWFEITGIGHLLILEIIMQEDRLLRFSFIKSWEKTNTKEVCP